MESTSEQNNIMKHLFFDGSEHSLREPDRT